MTTNKKGSSLAATATGTASSTCRNNITFPPIFQAPSGMAQRLKEGPDYDVNNQGDAYNPDYMYGGESYTKALHAAVTYVCRTAHPFDSLDMLSERVVIVTDNLVYWVDSPREGHGDNHKPPRGRGLKWARPKAIDPVQAAELVFMREVVRMVCVSETIGKETSEGVFAVYDWDEGIYREIGDGQIDRWCHELAGSVNGSWKKNFVQKLHDMASRRENRVCGCDDPALVFMANGIWDYEKRVMLDFSPDVVSLRKSATALPDREPPVPTHTMPDGTLIDLWNLFDSYTPYDGGCDLLVKLAGACLRSYHNWRVMVTLYNKTGHNGKSSVLDFLKALVGFDGCMTSSLALLAGGGDGGRFGVSNIVGVSLITCEDSDSGAYLKDNSRLKNIISHDAIGVERKNKSTFDYTPHALIVCAANDIPKTRDKGDAWLDRNIYVPFTGQFTGKADDKTIRSEWLVSREVCEYMAYQSLVKWSRYYELPEPEEAAKLKHEWVLGNDTVAEFWDDFKDSVHADFLPNDYLSERYGEWLRTEHPGMLSPMNNKALVKRISELACADGEWMQVMGADGKPLKTNCEKWCPNIYLNPVYNRPRRRRGIYRTVVFEYCNAHGTTPAALGNCYEAVRVQLGVADRDDNETD